MGIKIVSYGEELREAVKDFNSRLGRSGVSYRFPESHIPHCLQKLEDRETYQEYFLAVEDGFVRGGYVLQHQPFWIKDQVRRIGSLQLPLSEGIVNKAYSMVAMSLLTDAIRRQPPLYMLGIGSMDEPLVKMLQAIGWSARAVPFYFRVVHPARFLRQIDYLRTSSLRKGVLNMLAVSGVGWAAIKLAQAARRRNRIKGVRLDLQVVSEFSGWCDQLWDRCKTEYLMTAVRDSANLNILYPKDSERFIRVKVLRERKVIGWVVMLTTQMSGHKHFGDMKVGSIVDCLALLEDARLVIEAATDYLESAGVDLIVSNQSAHAWRQALGRTGYLCGPSNFMFLASKELTRLSEPLSPNFSRIHLNRGDGEGPTNL
jgi:hypothetical protein